MLERHNRLAAVHPPEDTHSVYHQRFAIEYDYPVWFTDDLFDPANPVFSDAVTRIEADRLHRLMVFVDDGVATAFPDLVAKVADYVEHHDGLELAALPELVPGGEAAKNDPGLIERLQRRLTELGIDRHAFVVAIGGGAVLDAVGFVAATTHRGIRHVRVPTTVLAQNDSGVGVKNGVNAFGIKNLIGSFTPPFAVLNDFTLLQGLGRRDKIAGMAEAVKVALIRDAAFFWWLEEHADDLAGFEPAALRHLIRRCAELHMRQIAHGGDPFETGSARPLDFGHWSAHKLEVLTAHALSHGEAVAIGIALDARYSVLAGMLTQGEDMRICRLLRRLGFALWHPALRQPAAGGGLAVLAGLQEFREHLGGELTITLLAGIGQGAEVHEMDEGLILAAIDWLEEAWARP
jgi:3-dehydroquinate synthase